MTEQDPQPERPWQAPLSRTSANLTAWLQRELERKQQREQATPPQSATNDPPPLTEVVA